VKRRDITRTVGMTAAISIVIVAISASFIEFGWEKRGAPGGGREG
jgi:hypothetical protein